MNSHEVGEVVQHGLASYDERFNEVLGPLVAHARLEICRVPAGTPFQIPVRRSHVSFVRRMTPTRRNDLHLRLQAELEQNFITVDKFFVPNGYSQPYFVMHWNAPA